MSFRGLVRTIRSKPVINYIVVVAAIYLLAFIGSLIYLEGAEAISLGKLKDFWPAPIAALGISSFLTVGSIASRGNAGGSLFAVPTLMHIFILFFIVFSVVTTGQ